MTKPKVKFNENFFQNVAPIKITEAHKLDMNSEGWGIISDFYLESVKVYRSKGAFTSVAIIKIGDRVGDVVCVIKGSAVAALFDLLPEDWTEIEELCINNEIFYRYFRDGVSKSSSLEQKIFYNFCVTNQTNDILVAVFKRSVNYRTKDKNDPLLEIILLQRCKMNIFDLYINYHKQIVLKNQNI